MELRLKKYSSIIFASPLLSQVYAPTGQLLKAGETCYRKSFAKALRLVAQDPIKSFYTGEIASSLVATSSKTGGIFTMRDFAEYRPGKHKF